ncbi:MAG: hypothetical protein ACLRXB_17125 [Escherichia coli]
MDDTGISWQQRLGDWWQDDKPWLREAPVGKVKQRDWFFWRQKRGVVVAGRMSAEEGKSCTVGANSWLAADCVVATGQPLPCRSLVRQCQSDQRAAAGANCGATGKQPDGQTAPAMAGKL